MTDSMPGEPGPILDYSGPAEPPAVESWTAASVVGVLASAVVLGGVILLVIELLAYLLA